MQPLSRRAPQIVAVAIAFAVLVAIGSASGAGRLGTITPVTWGQRPTTMPTAARPSMSGGGMPDYPQENGSSIPGWVFETLFALLVAVALLALGVLIWRIVRAVEIRRQNEAAAATRTGVEIGEIPMSEVEETLEASIVDLRSGLDVDDAILECWRRLELLGERIGQPREPAETSAEYVSTLLAATPARAEDLDELAGLYRVAMFSGLASNDDAREQAIACLERVSEAVRPEEVADA